MRLRKEMILFTLLVIFSVCIIAAARPQEIKPDESCKELPAETQPTCKNLNKISPLSPFNFLSRSVLHIKS